MRSANCNVPNGLSYVLSPSLRLKGEPLFAEQWLYGFYLLVIPDRLHFYLESIVNSLNYPIKITDIQIYKSLDYQNLFWLKKQFSSIRILSVIWISFSGTDKICLFITVKLYEGQNFVPCIRSGNKRGTKS